MSFQATLATVDVRGIRPTNRHPLIFSTFRNLTVNEALELLDYDDPRALYDQFESQLPGKMAWEYLECGRDVWRVRITKPQVESKRV